MITRLGALASVEQPEQSDEDVIREVLAGNTGMFELLMRRYNERVYRAARSIVRGEQDAEDVMQQAYVNAFKQLRQFNGSARFSTWLTRIAINESLARVRRQCRYPTCNLEDAHVQPFIPRGTADDPERQAFTRELRTMLEWAIDALPPGLREVFVLREVEGMNTAETAECLGLSDDVVKTRLSRARAALRRLLLARTGATALDAFRFRRPRCDRIVAAVLARVSARPQSCHLSGPDHSDQ